MIGAITAAADASSGNGTDQWTPLLAIATVILAAATFWLVWEARTARRSETDQNVRRLLRAALVELRENVNTWSAGDPGGGSPAWSFIPEQPLPLRATRDLLAGLDVPGDLLGYLTYATKDIEDSQEMFLRIYQGREPQGGPQDWMHSASSYHRWTRTLFRLLVVGRLLVAEADRRGKTDVANAFRHQFELDDRKFKSPRAAPLEAALGNQPPFPGIAPEHRKAVPELYKDPANWPDYSGLRPEEEGAPVQQGEPDTV